MSKGQTSILLQGIPASPGYAMGRIFYLQSEIDHPPVSSFQGAACEWQRFLAAQKSSIGELMALSDRARERLGESESEIFELHAMLLSDEDLTDRIHEMIDQGMCAEEATRVAAEQFQTLLSSLDDPYLSGRADDVKDVAERLISTLSGKAAAELPETGSYLLAAEDLTPAQTLLLDQSRILGIITRRGTRHSHAAILARAMGIPAVVGMIDLPTNANTEFALLDAHQGILTLSPSESERENHQALIKAQNASHEGEKEAYERMPSVTRSGHRILVYANIGEERELERAMAEGADGIGLWRSEMPYLAAKKPPKEELLFESYCHVAKQMKGSRVVIRTLDIGGDKLPSYLSFPKEENPALGLRGIRASFSDIPMFKTQLRAILRASAHGNIALMLPMVVSLEEIQKTKALLEDCREELKKEKKTYARQLEFGVMIETPAAAIMAHEIAPEVDFFSVGTNDLTQYTLAADRQNESVAALCDANYEPVLRLIRHAAEEIHAAGGWIGICGELAADPTLTQRFVDMKIDEVSVSPPYLRAIRRRIQECD